MKIKLCGLNTPEGIGAAIMLQVEYVGMVCFPPSPRHVSVQDARQLKNVLPSNGPKLVMVTVNPDDTLVDTLIRDVQPHGLQLHGDESPTRVAELRNHFPQLKLIKALGLHTTEDLNAAKSYATLADMLLFDAKPPTSSLPGGTGQSFDWTLLKGQSFSLPWFLSGGLNEANVADAIRISGAKAVDVSSGIESAPGVKDPAKMQAFVHAAQSVSA